MKINSKISQKGVNKNNLKTELKNLIMKNL